MPPKSKTAPPVKERDEKKKKSTVKNIIAGTALGRKIEQKRQKKQTKAIHQDKRPLVRYASGEISAADVITSVTKARKK